MPTDLTSAIETYRQQGFAIIPDIISPQQLAELRTHVDQVLDGDLSPTLDSERDDFQIQWEPAVEHAPDIPRRDKVRIVFHMTHCHPYFRDLARSPHILRVMQALVSPQLRYYTDQMFVKPAHHGSEVPWHQDAAYWPHAEPRFVSLWLAIDDVTIANGCVRYLPGTQRAAVPHHIVDTDNPNKLTCRPETVDPAQEIPVEMTAGSACIHHSLAIHRSLPNPSAQPRRGLVMIYLPADTHIDDAWQFQYGFHPIP